MPFPLAGLKVNGDERFAEQPIAGPVPAVVVPRRHLDGQVSDSEVGIYGYLSPDTRISRIGPGVLLPGIQTKLARLGNGMENPEPLACPHVKSADVAFDGALA